MSLFAGKAEKLLVFAEMDKRANISTTQDAARALARLGNCDICPSSEVEMAIQSLSVTALGLPQENCPAFSCAGLKRPDDMANRPPLRSQQALALHRLAPEKLAIGGAPLHRKMH